jgi:hypothetical protein
MNLRLLAAKIGIPTFVKKKKLDELLQLTAQAFGCVAPEVPERSYRDRLKSYAEFTRSQAERCLRRSDTVEEVESRLLQGAHHLGEKIRRDFRLKGPKEVMDMSRVLYRLLEIDFEGEPGGEVIIKRCFFSDYYSPETCRLISSIDVGLAAGLSGGGMLSFSQRLTEGGACCRARLVLPEKKA